MPALSRLASSDPADFFPEQRRRPQLRLVHDAAAEGPNAVRLLQNCAFFLSCKDFAGVIAVCDRAIDLNEDFSFAHALRGEALFRSGDFEGAIAACDQAITSNPQSILAHTTRGDALFRSGRFDEAIAECDRAISLDPKYAHIHAVRADALRRSGDFKRAIEAAECAIAIDPDYALAHAARADALRRSGDFEGAIQAARRAVALIPDYVFAYGVLADALRNAERFDEAVAACDQALTINPGYAFVHAVRGHALCECGDLEGAIAACDVAVTLEPEAEFNQDIRATVLRDVARAFFDAKRYPEALAACDRAINCARDKVAWLHVLRGTILCMVGRFPEAIAACDRAVAIDPNIDVSIIRQMAAKYGHSSRNAVDQDNIAGAVGRYYNNNINTNIDTSAQNGAVDVAANDLSAEKGLSDGVPVSDLLPAIRALAARLPPRTRKDFIRTVERAAELALTGTRRLNSTLLDREDRFAECLKAYEGAPTNQHASNLVSAFGHLRAKQKELGLALEERGPTVAQADSQRRPSKATPRQPGKPPMGRPRLPSAG